MTIDFPRRERLAQLPTPLQPLRRLQQQTGGPLIWLKRDDLTGSVLGGNKVRKLEFIAAYAIDNGYDTLLTCGGIQSNHCRATALAAVQLGLHCHLVLRGVEEKTPEGNFLLDKLSGVDISCFDAKEYNARLDTIFAGLVADYASKGSKALAIPTGGSDGVGIWGYIKACEELAADIEVAGIRPSAIVCAAGSGGTQAGLMAGSELFSINAPVYGVNVCDDAQYFQDKIASDFIDWSQRYSQAAARLAKLPSQQDVNIIEGYVGAGYGKASDEVLASIMRLASLEGVVLDPVYTGKAFHGLLGEIASGRFDGHSDLVFVHTGGVFGLFSFKQQVSALLS